MSDIKTYYQYDTIQERFLALINDRLNDQNIPCTISSCLTALEKNNPAKLHMNITLETASAQHFHEKITALFQESKKELDSDLEKEEQTCEANLQRSQKAISLWQTILPDNMVLKPPRGYERFNPDDFTDDKTLYRLYHKNTDNLRSDRLDTKKTSDKMNAIANNINEILLPLTGATKLWEYTAFYPRQSIGVPVPPTARDDGLIDPPIMLVNAVVENKEIITKSQYILKNALAEKSSTSLSTNSWMIII